MSPAHPDPIILLLGAVLPIASAAFVILLLKIKGFLFFDFDREERKRPRLLVAPILVVTTLAMGSNALFHKEHAAGVAWLVLCAAVIALPFTKSSQEAKAKIVQRMQAEQVKKEASQ